MFERFTARARRSLVLAQEEAAVLRHDFIGTEHLLLGLLHEGEGVAALALKDLGFELESLRGDIAAIIGPTIETPIAKPPFTPRSKRVLELSLKEALSLGHNYIGTEHLLLAIVREGDGVGSQVLAARGFAEAAVRQAVITKLAGYGGGPDRPEIRRPPGPSPRVAAPAPHTPAVDTIIPTAEALAQGGTVGSQHLLLAILDEPDSLAARAMASFGVTKEALMARFEEIGVEGTTDEVAQDAGFDVDAAGGEITIRIVDAALAEKVRTGELTVTFTKNTA